MAECKIRKILLVEDIPGYFIAVKLLLEHRGYVVCMVNNELDAVTMAAKEKFDLILMDHQMPLVDGIRAAWLIREKGGNFVGLTYESVYEKVMKIVADELNVDESKIGKNLNFQDDLGADSLAVIEIIMAIEEEFDIEIPEDQEKKVLTMERAVKYVIEKKG